MECTTIIIALTFKNTYKVGYMEKGELYETQEHKYYGDAQLDAGRRQMAIHRVGKLARIIELTDKPQIMTVELTTT